MNLWDCNTYISIITKIPLTLNYPQYLKVITIESKLTQNLRTSHEAESMKNIKFSFDMTWVSHENSAIVTLVSCKPIKFKSISKVVSGICSHILGTNYQISGLLRQQNKSKHDHEKKLRLKILIGFFYRQGLVIFFPNPLSIFLHKEETCNINIHLTPLKSSHRADTST